MHILPIAILSVHLFVTRLDQSKTVQARIIESSPLAAWETLVSGTIKLSHKFINLKEITPSKGAK